MAKRNWKFLTNHGLVLFHIVRNPQDTIRRIAEELGLAERTVAGILADLRNDGYITVGKRGKFNIYTVNPQLPMRHFSQAHYSVRDFFPVMAEAEERLAHPVPYRYGSRAGERTPLSKSAASPPNGRSGSGGRAPGRRGRRAPSPR